MGSGVFCLCLTFVLSMGFVLRTSEQARDNVESKERAYRFRGMRFVALRHSSSHIYMNDMSVPR